MASIDPEPWDAPGRRDGPRLSVSGADRLPYLKFPLEFTEKNNCQESRQHY
jgi:hypothetical protein